MNAYPNAFLLPVPERLHLTEDAQTLTITWRWFNPTHLVSFGFALIWNGFLVFFYSMLLAGDVPGFFFLFPLLHLLVGIWLLYYSVCGMINHTVIHASRRELTIRHFPLPWSGMKTIPRSTVRQLYVQEHVKREKHAEKLVYDIRIITAANKSVRLIRALDSPGEARFIEKKLEAFLKIQDQPVSAT